MEELLHLLKKLAVLVLLFPLKISPIRKNRIVLNNGLSHNYSDSPKAVAEWLLKNYPGKFNIIFAVDVPAKYSFLRDKGITPVKFHSFSYFYCVSTAAVYLTNNGGYSYIPRRKGRLVIETWHGGGAYKKCGIWEYKHKAVGKIELKLSARKLDLFLSTSKRSSEMFSRCFLLSDGIFWEIGMPRNDMLVHQDAAAREKIRNRLGMSGDERLALFAPTFRRQSGYVKAPSAAVYGIDSERVCAALQERFGGAWRFAFRLHPGVKNRDGILERGTLDLSDYGDMQELLLAADVLITDFSSVVWDFMLTDRPCFLFALDFDDYMETTDVYTPMSEWPFSRAHSNEELENDILTFDEDRYRKECARHYTELGGCETGKAAQMVGERICGHIADLKG